MVKTAQTIKILIVLTIVWFLSLYAMRFDHNNDQFQSGKEQERILEEKKYQQITELDKPSFEGKNNFEKENNFLKDNTLKAQYQELEQTKQFHISQFQSEHIELKEPISQLVAETSNQSSNKNITTNMNENENLQESYSLSHADNLKSKRQQEQAKPYATEYNNQIAPGLF